MSILLLGKSSKLSTRSNMDYNSQILYDERVQELEPSVEFASCHPTPLVSTYRAMSSMHHHIHSSDRTNETIVLPNMYLGKRQDDKAEFDELESVVADSCDSCDNNEHNDDFEHMKNIGIQELCGPKPSRLVNTHFKIVVNHATSAEIKEEAIQLIQRLQNTLQDAGSTNGFDFSLVSTIPIEWKGKFVKGNKSCVIKINVYRDFGCDDEDGKNSAADSVRAFIVEVVKTKGDPKPFCDFYREFKQTLTGVDELADAGVSSLRCPGALSMNIGSLPKSISQPIPMTVEKTLKAIQCIHTMANEFYLESKLEAARMLYDLSLRDQSILNDSRIIDAAVPILVQLIASRNASFPEVVEQAIIACGSFCDIPSYRRPIMHNDDCFLAILRFVGNPGKNEHVFDTAQVRRESARIIATFCCSDVAAFVTQLQNCQVVWKKWLASLDQIKDSRMRVYTQKIQQVVSKRYLRGDSSGHVRDSFTFNYHNNSGSYGSFDRFHY